MAKYIKYSEHAKRLFDKIDQKIKDKNPAYTAKPHIFLTTYRKVCIVANGKYIKCDEPSLAEAHQWLTSVGALKYRLNGRGKKA